MLFLAGEGGRPPPPPAPRRAQGRVLKGVPDKFPLRVIRFGSCRQIPLACDCGWRCLLWHHGRDNLRGGLPDFFQFRFTKNPLPLDPASTIVLRHLEAVAFPSVTNVSRLNGWPHRPMAGFRLFTAATRVRFPLGLEGGKYLLGFSDENGLVQAGAAGQAQARRIWPAAECSTAEPENPDHFLRRSADF
jgi:hypothetical protein